MTNNESPVTTHHAIGRTIAGMVGRTGSEVAMLWRSTGLPFYDKRLIPAMGKPHSGTDSESDAVLWYLLRLFASGNLAVGYIPVGEKPKKDKDRSRNQEILDTALPSHVVAQVDQTQKGAGCDGRVRLTAAVKCELVTYETTDDGEYFFGCEEIEFGPLGEEDDGLPLEIGNTDITRTVAHLRQFGAVVRWPYSSEDLVLLALHGDAKADFDVFFESDMKANTESSGGLVNEVGSALMALLYIMRITHSLYELPPAVIKDRQHELRVVAVMAARKVHQIPLAMFVHIHDTAAEDRCDAPERVVTEEEGVTKVVGWGVTVYAKGARPSGDCAAPWDLSPSPPPGPYSRLMAKVSAASPGRVIPVPPSQARAYLRTALAYPGLQPLEVVMQPDFDVLYEAIEDLRRLGHEPTKPTS